MVFGSSDQVICWGIIGCGDVCELKSGPAFSKVEGSQLVAVMRRDFDKAKDYAARHNVERYYSDADALIADPEVDAVYIATPPSSHRDYALKVAAAGKICCVEKPMAMNYKECLEMNAAFSLKKIPLFVAYYRRSLPRFRQIKIWLEQGLIGQVFHLQSVLRKPPSEIDIAGETNWRTQPHIAGGGYFVDLACHGLDLFSYLLGDIIEAGGVASSQKKQYPAEDSVSASWKFANGITGSGSWHFIAQDLLDKVTIFGEKGTIEFAVFEDEPIRVSAENNTQEIFIKHPEHVQYVHIQNMIRHLRDGITHPSTGESAAKANWVMDKILHIK